MDKHGKQVVAQQQGSECGIALPGTPPRQQQRKPRSPSPVRKPWVVAEWKHRVPKTADDGSPSSPDHVLELQKEHRVRVRGLGLVPHCPDVVRNDVTLAHCTCSMFLLTCQASRSWWQHTGSSCMQVSLTAQSFLGQQLCKSHLRVLWPLHSKAVSAVH